MQDNSYKPYKPITSNEQTTNIGASILSQTSNRVQQDAANTQARIDKVINQFTRTIPGNIINIFQNSENAALENFNLTKNIADNEIQAKLNEIDTDINIPAVQKAIAKKRLALDWRNQSNAMVDSFERGNNFALRQSNINLGELKNKNEQFFNKLENDIALQAQKDNINDFKQTLKNQIQDISKSFDSEQLQQNKNLLLNTIYNNPYLNRDEKSQFLQTTVNNTDLAEFNIEKEAIIDLNNQGFNGSVEALSRVREAIKILKLTKDNGMPEALPDLLNRVPKIIELERLEKSILKQIDTNGADTQITNLKLDLNTSDSQFALQVENSPLYKSALKDNNENLKNNIINARNKELEIRRKNPVGILLRNEPNLTVIERQLALNDAGLNNKTVLTLNDQKIFTETFNRIGTLDAKDNNGKDISTTSQLKDSINRTKQFFKGDNKFIIKEAYINSDPMQAVAIEMEIENNPYKVQFLDFMVQKNKTGNRPSVYSQTQMDSKRADFLTDKKYGTFLAYTNPDKAVKLANVAIDMEQYSKMDKRGGTLKVKDGSKIFKPNYEYIISSDRTIILEIDKTKYNPNLIQKQVSKVQRSPQKYLNLNNLTEEEIMRLRGGSFTNNITVQTNDNNEVEFYFSGQKAGREKVPLGKLNIDALPIVKTDNLITFEGLNKFL